MIVLYAINDSEIYRNLALQSICSLRYYSPKIAIKLCHFGYMPEVWKKKFTDWNVIVDSQPQAPAQIAWGLKWFALERVSDIKRVLFVDADTVFYEAVEKIFGNLNKKDFYAREETAAMKNVFRGHQFIKKIIKQPLLTLLQKKINANPMPLFNTSVMLFNFFSHKKVVSRLPVFMELFWGFHRKEIPYPATNLFVAEEVAGSLILGIQPALKTEFLPESLVTHFNHWCVSDKNQFGVIMHIGGGHILQYLWLFGLKEQYKKMAKVYKKHYNKTESFIHPLSGLMKDVIVT